MVVCLLLLRLYSQHIQQLGCRNSEKKEEFNWGWGEREGKRSLVRKGRKEEQGNSEYERMIITITITSDLLERAVM